MASPSSSPNNGSQACGVANPEVLAKAQRRIYTAEYKLQMLQERDSCSEGHIGAILRREGLSSSPLTTWRRQRPAGQLAALTANKRGRKPAPENPLSAEVERLRRENQRFSQRLEQAELIIAIQKKASASLPITLATKPNDHNDSGVRPHNLPRLSGLRRPALDEESTVPAMTASTSPSRNQRQNPN